MEYLIISVPWFISFAVPVDLKFLHSTVWLQEEFEAKLPE